MRRADRLFRIIQTLRRSRRPVTATELAAEFEVTRRSIYRDVAVLMAQHVPIRGEAGVGYVIDREFDMPPLMLTADELEAAVLGAQWVAERGDRALATAARDLLAKISASIPAHLRVFVSEPTVGAPVPLDRRDDRVDIAQVRRWIRAGRKIRIRYEDEGGKRTRRTIWPVMIGYTDAVRLIAAWCEQRSAFRHFRTDRILDAEFLEETIAMRPSSLLARWRAHMDERGVRLP
ncbi:MAG: helix-turn-helix transcriptional regulator [Myxococcota bacterium]